ncbi:PDT-domain-containing protein [Westerdykella ornata]|uniref:prephenate dehydratase n=1 Tax=Westerdykella ornata TaxID=318751 RepID=A0A6A6JBW8_WESOR|nr:PDT-domain-containing protein [Westerdykella ornata]KAF2273757.1 PDT-domain-containing protein [Westerdykella ornata]
MTEGDGDPRRGPDKEGEVVVAYLGPRATYSHQAALSLFPPSPTIVHKPVPTIPSVFSAVQSGAVNYGIVPFENSTNGSVVFTLDLFADRERRNPDVVVCGEGYVRVRHCLVGHPNPATTTERTENVNEERKQHNPADLSDLAHITTLYTHPQVWTQCTRFLSLLSSSSTSETIDRIDTSSTSRAAELVAHDPSRCSAAICNALAAQTFGLPILRQDIQDDEGNETRFFVLRRRDAPASLPASSPYSASTSSQIPTQPQTQSQTQEEEDDDDDKDWKTLVSFTIEHHHPGSLAQCLAVFERHAINLTSINTRPSGEGRWNYVFFVECWGRRRRTRGGEEGAGLEGGGKGEEEGPVDRALRELDGMCRGWRWLGSWRSNASG